MSYFTTEPENIDGFEMNWFWKKLRNVLIKLAFLLKKKQLKLEFPTLSDAFANNERTKIIFVISSSLKLARDMQYVGSLHFNRIWYLWRLTSVNRI